MSVGIIAALPAEALCFTQKIPVLNAPFTIHPRLTAVVCGMGREAADAAARTLISLNSEALISWGIAGALSPGVRSGDLLLPDNILTGGGRELATDKDWRDRIRQALQPASLVIHGGGMTETRHVLTAATSKRELHRRTGALAADMETAAVLERASAAKIPCIAIRAIVDEADMILPESLLRHIDRFGRAKFSGLMIEIARTPGLAGALLRLGMAMRRATSTLKTVARLAHPVLLYNQ